MKVIKDQEHGLHFRSFRLKGRIHLTIAIMIFFDLKAPDPPLTEKEMWSSLSKNPGPDLILDQGMPKARGEFLVKGACHAPNGRPVEGTLVAVQVGHLQKRIMVFGPRRWIRGVISQPESFTEMPIIYKNAFGGPNFDRNPLGKGHNRIMTPSGEKYLPLPNLEDPDHLLLDSLARPDPACFEPLDITWPQRRKKEGTYDQKWIRDVMPELAHDTAEDMFNVAPEDQQIKGFFQPGDEVIIKNMHPEIPLIRSHLPNVRNRLFITKMENLKKDRESPTLFEEMETRIDTIWLFPDQLRGVMVYRGLTHVLDDELADVVRVFCVSEDSLQAPKDVEFYIEAEKKRLARPVEIDKTPFENLKKKVSNTLRKVKDIPKDLELKKQQALGKAPVLMRTPAELERMHTKTINQGHQTLDKAALQLAQFREKHGALIKADPAMIDRMRGRLDQASQVLGDTVKKATKILEEAEKKKKEGVDLIKSKVRPDVLARTDFDPDSLLAGISVNPWHDRGFPLVSEWVKNLEINADWEQKLKSLGFYKKTANRAWLGFKPEESKEMLKDWGLEPETRNPATEAILPAGLVVPRFNEAVLSRVLIRPGDPTDPSRDFLMPGSDETPRAFLYEDRRVMVRTADELEAVFLDQEIWDFAGILALPTPDAAPDPEAQSAVEAAEFFLVILPEKTEAAEKEGAAWLEKFPQAQILFLPEGKNVFEAHLKGHDIRVWLLEALPEDLQEAYDLNAVEKDPANLKKILPMWDIPAMVKKLSGEIKASIEGPLLEKKKQMMTMTQEQLDKNPLYKGPPVESLFAEAEKSPEYKPISEKAAAAIEHLSKQKDQLAAKGLLTPEVEAQMNEMSDNIGRMSADADKKYQAGMAKLAEAKEKIAKVSAGELPPEVAQALEEAGLDPKRMKKLTREEVVRRLETGESLAGANMTELDLSGLDFSGRDLSGAWCRGTNFTGANLSRTDLSKVIAKGADFTGADLKEANLSKLISPGACFKEANLEDARLIQTLLPKTDLTGAVLDRAVVEMSIFHEANLKSSSFKGTQALQTIFSKSDLSNSFFTEAQITKCAFTETKIDESDMSRASLASTLFRKAEGQKVNAENAVLEKCGIFNSVLPGANFRQARLTGSMLKESNLSAARFDYGVLDRSIIKNCDLRQAVLARASAKKSRFIKTDLEEANMTAINLFLGSLQKSHLVKTNFTGANLFGVDFLYATVGDTKFELANLKRSPLFKRTDLLGSKK